MVANRDDLIDQYLDAIEKEISFAHATEVDTIFFGGGTPTHLSASQLGRLLKIIKAKFSYSSQIEFTTEANPHDISHEKIQTCAEHGVNRISLGAQSFNSQKLEILERDHQSETIKNAIDIIKPYIANVSIDLIIGAPGETIENWVSDLQSAVALSPSHISTYSLTIEKGTQFWNRWHRGDLATIPEEAAVKFYEAGIEFLQANGFEHYEVSNFAKPGFRCVHNESCWFGKSYFGFGPGAARFVNGKREMNHRSTTRYLQLISSGKSPTVESDLIDEEELAREKLIFGLRRLEGIDIDRFENETQYSISDLAGKQIEQLVQQGLLKRNDNRLQLSRSGLLVSDAIWPLML